MENWIFIAFLGALFLAITNLLNKKVNSKLNEYSVGWSRNLFALPVFWALTFSSGIPKIDSNFWLLIAVIAPIELLIALLYFKALKTSPLSLTMPITALLTVFIALGSYFILSERLSPTHLAAILLIVLGSYLLNINPKMNKGILAPIKNLFKERGVLYMFIAAILFGITVPVGKILSNYSSVQFYVTVNFTLLVLLFTPFFLLKGDGFKPMKNNLPTLLLMGGCNALSLFFYWYAAGRGSASLAIAIQNTSILMNMIMAGTFLKEEVSALRFIAATFMVLGASIIALAA